MAHLTPASTFLCLASCLLLACGGGKIIRSNDSPKEDPAENKESAPDAFRDFRGVHVPAGKPFTLKSDPAGVDGVGVVVQLLRVTLRTWETTPGKPTSEGTAELTVARGTETRTIRIAEGEAKTALGARISIVRAVTEYVTEAADYLPVADLVVEAAP